MKIIRLNDRSETIPSNNEYTLDPTERYVINLEDEMEFQSAIMMSFQVMGPPPALKNYHAWLFENGFNVELPNPTNEVVASYYGVKPLWKTDYSQGIVVMAEDESDYFIVMECSSRNRGYHKSPDGTAHCIAKGRSRPGCRRVAPYQNQPTGIDGLHWWSGQNNSCP